MLKLNKDNNLKGYAFEYIIRILLRREKKNNFIFQVIRFTNLKELQDKYRLKFPKELKDIEDLLEKNWKKFDIIEFILNNTKDRIIKSIMFYDVKTQNINSLRKHLDFCKSNHIFFVEMKEKFNLVGKIIKVNLCADWQFNYIIDDFDKFKIKIYSRFIFKENK